MTAFGTTWNAWLGYGLSVSCILLALHVAWKISHRTLLDEAEWTSGGFWTAGVFWEVVGAVLVAATAIFLIFFSQRAGEAGDRPSTVNERRAMEDSIKKAPPMPSSEEIKNHQVQQDKDNLIHSGKSLKDRTDEANKATDEALKRWETK